MPFDETDNICTEWMIIDERNLHKKNLAYILNTTFPAKPDGRTGIGSFTIKK